MKRLVVWLMISVVLVAGAGYSQKGPKGMGMGMDKGMGKDRGMQHEMMDGFGVFMGLADIDVIMQKYGIKLQRAMLDGQEKMIGLNDKRRELTMDLTKLAEGYKADPTGTTTKIVADMKQLKQVTDQIHSIRKEVMQNIQKLNEDREKEINTAIETWMKKLETDKAEMQKFVDVLIKMKDMHKMGCPKDGGLEGMGPEGDRPGKGRNH